jgi:hypothetical protein
MEDLEAINMVVGEHMGSVVSTTCGVADVFNYLVRTGERWFELGRLESSGVPLQESKFARVVDVPSQGCDGGRDALLTRRTSVILERWSRWESDSQR